MSLWDNVHRKNVPMVCVLGVFSGYLTIYITENIRQYFIGPGVIIVLVSDRQR